LLIEKQQYWCVNCNFIFRVFSPFPAEYFQPELDVNYVLDKQKKCGNAEKEIITGEINNFAEKLFKNKSIQPLKAVKCDTSPRFST